MEANITTPLFKRTTVAKKIVKTNVDVDPALLMLEVIENCLYFTSPPCTIYKCKVTRNNT
jgi:hypothetical protein